MTSPRSPRPPLRKPVALPRPTDPEARPGCLTAVCLFLAFASFAWLLLAVNHTGPQGGWYPVHLIIQALAVGAAALGLWKMQKWGVLLLAAVAVLIHVLYFFVGLANIETFVIYVGVVAPAIYFYNRMK